ncbi:SPFH domain-containing protein [Desulfobacterales bacterium HSG16]|nr:SPFH domain-containing protein [Desulfobacterales bacterium HSG16]
MFWIFLAVLSVLIGSIVPILIPKEKKQERMLIRVISFMAALFFVISTSYVIIDSNKVGHMKRIYFGKPMESGQVIALDGQKGPQATLLPPGFKFQLFLNVIYDVEEKPVTIIKEGFYGFISANDGAPLEKGQYLAAEWPKSKFTQMQDASFFLKNGGQKGPQLSVLKPGNYRLNTYLFNIKMHKATDIKAGFVGVVKSNVQETDKFELAEVPHELKGALSVPLVKKGSAGVWNEPLPPGRYYLNLIAYNVTGIDTKVQTWNYKGGYIRRYIDLHVTQEGQIVQKERSEKVGMSADSADSAIFTRMEGWLVPQELRVQVQVEPTDAPFLVASVGTMDSAEDKVVTPSIRSVVRNICAAEKVLSLIDENRVEVEDRIEMAVIPEGKKAGITIKDVRLVDSMVPPELLVVRQREQLADQLEETFKKEKDAQDQRISAEKSRATADQQPELVAAEIRVEVAKKNKQAAQLQGEGEKLKLTEIAEGQKAQVQVLGQDRVMQLAVLEKILQAAVANPDIVKVPRVLVSESGGLEGAAAILGASNLVQGVITGKPEGAEVKKKPE